MAPTDHPVSKTGAVLSSPSHHFCFSLVYSFVIVYWGWFFSFSLSQVDPRRSAPERFSRSHHNERRPLPVHHMVRPWPESHCNSRGHALFLFGRRRVVFSRPPGGAGPQWHPGGRQAGGGGFQQRHPRQNPAGYVCRYHQHAGTPPLPRAMQDRWHIISTSCHRCRGTQTQSGDRIHEIPPIYNLHICQWNIL